MSVTNPILKRNFIYSSLKINHEGLFYSNKRININEKNKKQEFDRDYIFITDDVKSILNLLDIDFENMVYIYNEDKNDFYNSLVKNEKIRLDIFFNLKEKDLDTEEFINFHNYIIENEIEYRETYEKIKLEELFNINPDFYTQLKKSDYWLDNKKFINKKFNGSIIKKLDPNYDMRKLNKTLPLFKNNFKTKKEYGFFILENDIETIYESFIEKTS